MWMMRVKIAAGALLMFGGIPAAHGLLDGDPLRWWATGACVFASIWCWITANDGLPSS